MAAKIPAIEPVGAPIYKEMTRRLSPTELGMVGAKVEKVGPEALEYLVKALGTPWSPLSPIFTDGDLLFVALKGVKEGKITQEQAATLLLFLSTFELHYKIGIVGKHKAVRVERVATSDPKFKKMLASGKNKDNEFVHLSDKEQLEFIEATKSLPFSEQQCLLIGPHDCERYFGMFWGAAQPGFDVLGRLWLKPGEPCWQMVPSAGMMQVYLKIKFGARAVKANFIFGESSVEDIKINALEGSRDICIQSRHIKTPLKIHNFTSVAYNATKHDFTHAMIYSAIIEEHRILLVGIAEALGKKVKNRFAFIDMGRLFPPPIREQRALFWGALFEHFLPEAGEKERYRVGKKENLYAHLRTVFLYLQGEPLAQKLKLTAEDLMAFSPESENPPDPREKKFLERPTLLAKEVEKAFEEAPSVEEPEELQKYLLVD